MDGSEIIERLKQRVEIWEKAKNAILKTKAFEHLKYDEWLRRRLAILQLNLCIRQINRIINEYNDQQNQ